MTTDDGLKGLTDRQWYELWNFISSQEIDDSKVAPLPLDYFGNLGRQWLAANGHDSGDGEAAKLAKLQSSDNLYHVNLTCAELQAAADFGNPDKSEEDAETEMCIGYFKEGHSGPGYYVWYLEYPEEGCMKLTNLDAAILAEKGEV